MSKLFNREHYWFQICRNAFKSNILYHLGQKIKQSKSDKAFAAATNPNFSLCTLSFWESFPNYFKLGIHYISQTIAISINKIKLITSNTFFSHRSILISFFWWLFEYRLCLPFRQLWRYFTSQIYLTNCRNFCSFYLFLNLKQTKLCKWTRIYN